MAFIIKESKVKVDERKIFQGENGYVPFPNNDVATFDNDELIPIGVLSYNQFDSSSDDKILIAVPNLQGIPDGDYGPITYSFANENEGWRLDEEFRSDAKLDDQEDYLDNYKEALNSFTENGYIMESGEKAPLFEIGGQPPLGQNWDAILYDEMGDNPELDHYHEVTSDLNHPEFEDMNTRDIVYFDEEDEREYIFLGSFRDTPYLDLSGCIMVFYQPDLKKVMLVVEYD